jgi:hypothetical protein
VLDNKPHENIEAMVRAVDSSPAWRQPDTTVNG